MLTVVPCPGCDSRVMWPKACCTMPKTAASPSPVPLPGSLVVKKGSKARACTLAGIP